MKLELESLRAEIESLLTYFHKNPEISWNEVKTTEYIKQFLIKKGFEPHSFSDCTGLYTEIGSGDLCIALRTDMDALWQEVNGHFQANHSCGHDSHMTMAIGVLLLLQKIGFPDHVKLKFIFQPAEEKGSGALKMIDLGILNDVDFLYGVHVRPIQELVDGQASPAIYHGAGKFIMGEIIGEDAHGARPHLGQNAIEVGAALVNEIKSIHLNPMIPYSAKMTKFLAGGDSGNIIPGKASFSLDLRAQTNEAMEQLFRKVERICEGVSKLYNVEVNLETAGYVAAAQVNGRAKKAMKAAIIDTIGVDRLVDPVITAGGEDFHFYSLKKPLINSTMLGLGCDLKPGLHHPQMTFNHEAIYTGIEILTKTILNTIQLYGPKQSELNK